MAQLSLEELKELFAQPLESDLEEYPTGDITAATIGGFDLDRIYEVLDTYGDDAVPAYKEFLTELADKGEDVLCHLAMLVTGGSHIDEEWAFDFILNAPHGSHVRAADTMEELYDYGDEELYDYETWCKEVYDRYPDEAEKAVNV